MIRGKGTGSILWILQGLKEDGAGEGNRTLVASLEDWSSTIELHPQPKGILTPGSVLSIATMIVHMAGFANHGRFNP